MTLTQVTTGGVDENINIDSNTLKVDGTNNRVGIGTASPSVALEVSSGLFDAFKVVRTSSGAGGKVGIVNGNGSEFQIVNDGSTNFLFRLGSTERMRIDSSGRLLVGVTSNASSAAVQGFKAHGSTGNESGFTSIDTTAMAAGVGGEISFMGNTTTAGEYNYVGHIRGIKENATSGNTACALTFHTRPTATAPQERMRIDSSGRVLIGTSSARANFFNSTVAPQLQLEGDGDFTRQAAIISSSSVATQGGEFILAHQKSGSNGGNTLNADGDTLGQVSFQGNDGTHFVVGAQVKAEVDGTPGTDDMPGRLVFKTTADGANSATERMRIDSSGNVGIGITSPSSILHVVKNSTNNTPLSHNYPATQSGVLVSNNQTGTTGAFSAVTLRAYNSSGSGQSASIIAQSTGSGFVPSMLFTQRSGSGTNAERMRIDSSGRLNIGATSNSYADARLQVNASVGSFYVTQNSHLLLQNKNSSTTNWWNIAPRDDGTLTIGNGVPGSTGVVVDRKISVDSSGRLLVGTTTSRGRVHVDENGMLPDGGGWLNASLVTSGSFGGGVSLLDGSKGYTMFCTENGDDFFIRGATSTTANVSGGVKLNNRATSWTSASDEREKENLVSITGAIDKVKTLRTVTGNYTWDTEQNYAFLIAQDVQQVLPEAVHVMNKSAAVEDQRLGIAYTQTIPLLTAALKEAIAKIEILETKVAALEAAG